MSRKMRLLCRMLLTLCFITQTALQIAFAEEEASEGFMPRQSDFWQRPVPDGVYPLADGIPAEYATGHPHFAVWENALAFADDFGGPLLSVCELRNGKALPMNEYKESLSIISILLGEEGLAYLAGECWDVGETELVTVGPDGERNRVPVGATSWEIQYPPALPLARLKEGRFLFTDGDGTLLVSEANGSGLRQVTDAPVYSFVYCDPYVYFTNLGDMAVYKDVYCYEYGEYLDVSYPRLYRTRLDGTGVEQITDGGVRGLAAWGPYVFYQDIDDPYVWPQGEMPEEWLYGVVTRLDGATGRKTSLNLDSACYYPTAYGLAAWLPEFPDGGADSDAERTEGHTTGFSLILHDWDGKPLYRLDTGSMQWDDMTFFVGDRALWVWDGYALSAISLDGSEAAVIAAYP